MAQGTFTPTKQDVKQKWHFIDAEGKVLGKVAVQIAKELIGKSKVKFSPNLNFGDKVVVTNAEKIVATGKKLENKIYYRHTGYPKGLRAVKLGELMEKNPSEVIVKAVKNMLPNNKLRKERLSNLFVYKGTEHPHKAQAK